MNQYWRHVRLLFVILMVLVRSTTLSQAQTETVLVANFVNGNDAAFNSRVYLFNPSQSAGKVTVRVFTLPLIGDTAQELTGTPMNLGTLGARSALNLKLAEDILHPLGITTPYTDDGGNLTLEFTIEAANVRGAAQVFSSSFAFGTYPLQEIPPCSGGSPTVLVANFMNGNDAAFNSRVYLFNPSQSAGEVKARLFTVPLIGDTAQELTATPLSLGTLDSKSALNIKVAEDILDPLGITTPYTADGGNLTLEFTIEAANVRGAAQVFSSGIAFGTYPLQKTVVSESSAGLGPSVVSIEGRQLIVRRRNPDGTLAPATPYIIRGVLWSPASRDTDTSPTDPNNANVRRLEFGKWYQEDIPLMVGMNVNTVRLVIDPGINSMLGPLGRTILDELYSNGIMVIMTVDDGVNDMTRVASAVNFYKDHPAILMWMLGSEWNINLYFDEFTSVHDAARCTEEAAELIKQLDTNHPVATSYGDIDIEAKELQLSDTQDYVNNMAPSVDVWGLNIFRGKTFGSLFDQWASITSKPMFLGEFGTDAFGSTSPLTTCPQGAVDETTQADWDLSLWNDLIRNLSASESSKVALGGTVFEWNDEWWKVPPAESQERCGFELPGGHPDGFANEEYFGIADIDRKSREVYDALRIGFDPAYQPPPSTTTFQATSQGMAAPGSFAEFFADGISFYRRTGGAGGGRGFNIAVIDPATGELSEPVRNFDTWATQVTGTAMRAMIDFLEGVPDGSLIMIAVGDEAGLNLASSCEHLSASWVEAGLGALETLGSTEIRNYCWRDSWAMVAFQGEGMARDEQLEIGVETSSQITIDVPSGD